MYFFIVNCPCNYINLHTHLVTYQLTPAPASLRQTAQRKIREIIQQVKQQEQKHQQCAAAVSPHHSK